MSDRGLLYEDNLGFVEALYRAWLEDPRAVDGAWDDYFRQFDGQVVARQHVPAVAPPPTARPPHVPPVAPAPAAVPFAPAAATAGLIYKQTRVDSLLWAYRDVGYFYAQLNPLRASNEPSQNYLYPRAKGAYEQLSLERFGLLPEDLELEFSAGRYMQLSRSKLSDILKAFDQTYCSTVGVEFLHIQNKPIRNWLLRRMESCRNKPVLSPDDRRIILEDLIKAEEFEQFLHKTFIGQKRFSLEGAEVLIPALHFLVNAAGGGGIEEVVLGTTHRGRITILNHILSKPAEEVFTLFEDIHEPGQYGGSGDVKYHLGYSTEHRHENGSSVRVTLVSNPSHLESVDAVVEGKVRGLQSRGRFWQAAKQILPVILHGDAAFSGQGIVAETFNLSQVQGYHTGGTIHIIINNQIGFTTSSQDSRSTFFPTDVAKMTSVPVFHVNGDDPEAVVHVIALALEFRQKMSMDVVIDIVCYRRHGHNEGDEPSFTNPRMYKIIREHPGVARQFGDKCARSGLMSSEEQEGLRRQYASGLRQALKAARTHPPQQAIANDQNGYSHRPIPTGVPEPVLRRIAGVLTSIPEVFHAHPKLKRILEDKRQKLEQEGSVDWAFAESLAFGSLLLEGTPVRLSGQDCERGTFSQRHAAWWDAESPQPVPYVPLNHLEEGQARFDAHDSPLSEYSVLGFEYGFSLSRPDALVVWEAQFGDFSNGAQVIIDNFIVSAESKWQRASGLVLLLPHGYEGQGPEHSSAHLERFLQLCAQDNIEVCNASTPAQYFHLLRRQVKRGFRKPLVLMSPKSLLRHPLAVSPFPELASGHFRTVLDQGEQTPAAVASGPAAQRPAALNRGEPGKTVRRVILCSGKLFYELWERRQELGASDTAIVRIEQLYPFPAEPLADALGSYRKAERLLWVQEEPENRGPLRFMREQLGRCFSSLAFEFISRPASASPAVGSYRLHAEEQRRIVESAFSQP